MNKMLVIVAIVTTLSGCQTTIEANQYTVLDPEVNFDTNLPIVVETFDENDLSSKFYIRSVIEGLKNRGFNSVYTKRELTDQNITAAIAAFIKVDEEFDTFTYESADYGMVDSGYSTTSCTGFGVTASCNTTKQKTYGVIGSSTKTGSTVYHSFSLHYYDLVTQQKVLFALGSTFEKSCNSDFLYEFLIDETLSRTNFNKPEDYAYKVKLPEGVKCNIR